MFKALIFAFGIFVGMTIANGWRDWVDIAKTKATNITTDVKKKYEDTKTFFFPTTDEKDVISNKNFNVDSETLVEAEQFAKKYDISIIKALQILKDQQKD